MTICRYHIKEMIIFLRKIQCCLVLTPVSTLNNTGVMLNSVDTSDNTGYSTHKAKINSESSVCCCCYTLNVHLLSSNSACAPLICALLIIISAQSHLKKKRTIL